MEQGSEKIVAVEKCDPQQMHSPCERDEYKDEEVKPPNNTNKQNKPDDHGCLCENCLRLVAKFSECEICMNPLQNNGVVTCSRCGAYWCGSCSKRMEKCPYCRTAATKQFSKALSRLLGELNLPCRNRRLGCDVTLTGDTRHRHESVCPHRQLVCPVSEKCGCCLSLDEMGGHIARLHDMTAFSTPRVNVVIESFDAKMTQTAMTRHKYRMCLLVHGSAFVLKVSLYNFRIELSIAHKRLRYEVDDKSSSSSSCDVTFCALLEFHSRNFSTRTAVALNDKTVNRNTMISKNQYDSSRSEQRGDSATVCVTISPMRTKTKENATTDDVDKKE